MQVNFKQPKYVMPLLVLPFACLFFYVFHSSETPKQPITKVSAGLNTSVGEVAQDVRQKNLASKLDAFRDTYKESDGSSVVTAIPAEISSNPAYIRQAADQRHLDSVTRQVKLPFKSSKTNISDARNDQLLASALADMRHPHQKSLAPAGNGVTPASRDPMDVFRQQMAYMDSVSKENDPAYKAERVKRLKDETLLKQKSEEVKFVVHKATSDDLGFNTIRPPGEPNFIKAIIDENITGYAGSRLRLRLLDDISAGGFLIGKGTYLYALITGFSGQRVTLSIPSIMSGGKIFPVKLDIYDEDGLPGLYVPESAFRDFTKDLGGNTIQGISIDGGNTGSQLLMSTADKFFQSTSGAIAELIRKNKAKLKYSSFLYLIDAAELQHDQKNY